MNVRSAATADRETLRSLWEEFTAELDEPDFGRDTWEQAWEDMARKIEDGLALLAEDEGGAVGFALARMERPRVVYVSDLFVRERARRQGVAAALLREVLARVEPRGAEVVTLNVGVENAVARAIYRRLGFREESLDLVVERARLAERLSRAGDGPSFGSVHVQTDDAPAVERAVRQFVPRLPGGSRASLVSRPRNGWIAVYDELADRDPDALRRLGRELSDRLGGVVFALGVEHGAVVRYLLYEQGRVVDEYLSVPEFYGPLPPGDVVALGANPTAVARLTGADAGRVRTVARTAGTPDELPPAPELAAAVADALGLEGGGHGFAGANEQAGWTAIAYE